MSSPYTWKRTLRVAILMLAAIGVIAAFAQSPIDAFSGATPKSQRAASDRLTGSYVFGVRDSANLTTYTDTISHSRKTTLPVQPLTVFVPSDDAALLDYAQKWQSRLAKQHVTIVIKPVDSTLLRSRVMAGKYDAYLASTSIFPDNFLKGKAHQIFKAYEMR